MTDAHSLMNCTGRVTGVANPDRSGMMRCSERAFPVLPPGVGEGILRKADILLIGRHGVHIRPAEEDQPCGSEGVSIGLGQTGRHGPSHRQGGLLGPCILPEAARI